MYVSIWKDLGLQYIQEVVSNHERIARLRDDFITRLKDMYNAGHLRTM